MGKSKEIGSVITCFVLIALIAVFSALSVSKLQKEIEDAYYMDVSVEKMPLANGLSGLTPNVKTNTFPEGMLEKYKGAYAYNSDVIGYIKIPGTSIDTPVVQSTPQSGGKNNYYLRYDYYGVNTQFGHVYMDYRCEKDTLSKNTIIYGHNSRYDNQVFCDMDFYKDANHYKTQPIIQFDTLYTEYKWKIFAAFITTTESNKDNGYVFNYIYPEMANSKMGGYYDQVNQRKLYETGVDVNENDKILTLSTCTYEYGDSVDARFVIVARLLREGESEEIDTSLVKENSDYRRPQIWYDRRGQKNPYANRSDWYPVDK